MLKHIMPSFFFGNFCIHYFSFHLSLLVVFRTRRKITTRIKCCWSFFFSSLQYFSGWMCLFHFLPFQIVSSNKHTTFDTVLGFFFFWHFQFITDVDEKEWKTLCIQQERKKQLKNMPKCYLWFVVASQILVCTIPDYGNDVSKSCNLYA